MIQQDLALPSKVHVPPGTLPGPPRSIPVYSFRFHQALECALRRLGGWNPGGHGLAQQPCSWEPCDGKELSPILSNVQSSRQPPGASCSREGGRSSLLCSQEPRNGPDSAEPYRHHIYSPRKVFDHQDYSLVTMPGQACRNHPAPVATPCWIGVRKRKPSSWDKYSVPRTAPIPGVPSCLSHPIQGT